MAEERAKFGSKLGIILATAGSAVGLGNVWRFPYMAGEHGGAAFILLYIVCVLVLGIPCMVSEFIIGRRGASNTARAYNRMANGTPWKYIGLMGVLTGFLITGYYAVVSGWCLQYIFAAATGSLSGSPAEVKQYFADFSSSPVAPVIWTFVIMGITHFVIIHGVRGGIERASKMLMPTLFVLLIVSVVAACMLPGSSRGVAFLLKPDFSKVDGGVFLGALGQSFYSLSIGMGCLCTYASYFTRQTRLVRSATQITVIDTLVAVLAGLVIFPAAFSVGINPDSGPSLVFITLPNVFNQAFASVPAVGYVVAVVFYALLSLAALTSLISLHEVSTAFFYEELHITRKSGATIVSTVCCIIGVFCSLSLGPCKEFQVCGKSLFDFFDFLTGQILLPLGGFFTCLFMGWYVKKDIIRDELTNGGTLRTRLLGLYLFFMRVVCPIAIAVVFLNQLNII